MDNFRRYRPAPGRTQTTDGFITSKRRTAGSQANNNLRQTSQSLPTRPKSTRLIGDFNAADGFHPIDRSKNPEFNKHLETEPSIQKPLQDTAVKPVKITRRSRRKTKRADAKASRQHVSRFKRIRNHFIFNPFKPRNWTKYRALSSALIIALVFGAFFGGKAWLRARQIFKGGGNAVALQENVDPSLLRGEGDGRVNILLLGRGGLGHEGADLTDTIVVASINPIQKEAALLSIPRDLYVQTSGGGYSKINAVFANAKNQSLASSSRNDSNREANAEEAGLKAIESTIQAKIGIPIHYHAIIDFTGFRKAIDTVGGVDVNVPASGAVYENMWIMGQNYALNVSQGQQHFNGLRALAYSRSRHTSNRGDFDRSERQRMILVALKNKIFTAGTYSNPLTINRLMDDFGDHIRTNLGINEVKRIYEIGQQIDSSKIASVGLADPPNNYVTTGFIDGQSVVIPRAGLDDYKEIQFFVRNRLKDGFLAKENATVAVYNGTMITGLATLTAQDLKSYGYNVSAVADSPTKGVQKTIVVALRDGEKKYTKRYLENRFGTTAVGSLPANAKINPGVADFVIILGQNEQARLAN